MVKEFHEKFGMPVKTIPGFPKKDRVQLRLSLIDEEFKELKKAVRDGNIIEVADALGDLIYVIQGSNLEFGIPADEVFAEIHRSNMTKVWPDGEVHVREDGKVLKPKTYSHPNITKILRSHSQ